MEDLPSGWQLRHVRRSRCHGVPSREPWGYDEAFVNEFRRIAEMKYGLMPYIYAQAKESSEHGYPMLRTLFFEFRGIPSGDYQIRAVVGDARGHEVATAAQSVYVLASGTER